MRSFARIVAKWRRYKFLSEADQRRLMIALQNMRMRLIDRFREDDRCRAFLSTDAGGVELNLQHASIVVNMDLPWNPAVLEQRIGRVHRLGQRNPVQVINFIAQGTTEEGVLSVLTFKSALFAGVLDGGEREVFLGGSRLSRFMETVEKTTTAIGESADIGRDGGREAKPHVKSEPQTVAATTPRAAGQASGWAAVVQTGVAFLERPEEDEAWSHIQPEQ